MKKSMDTPKVLKRLAFEKPDQCKLKIFKIRAGQSLKELITASVFDELSIDHKDLGDRLNILAAPGRSDLTFEEVKTLLVGHKDLDKNRYVVLQFTNPGDIV